MLVAVASSVLVAVASSVALLAGASVSVRDTAVNTIAEPVADLVGPAASHTLASLVTTVHALESRRVVEREAGLTGIDFRVDGFGPRSTGAGKVLNSRVELVAGVMAFVVC